MKLNSGQQRAQPDVRARNLVENRRAKRARAESLRAWKKIHEIRYDAMFSGRATFSRTDLNAKKSYFFQKLRFPEILNHLA